MRLLHFPSLLLLIASAALATDLPTIPAGPIAKKKDLLFSDNFHATTPDHRWHNFIETFVLENGALKGSQTRDKEIPATNRQPAILPHAAVHALDLPTKDSVIEAKIRFDGASMIEVELADTADAGAHSGHICRAMVRLNSVIILDDREGGMRTDIYEMNKDPARKAEVAKLLIGRSATYPAKLEPDRSYTLTLETVADAMRVTLDGKPAAFLKSPGIAHPTKSTIYLGVAGKDAFFEDIKVWDAAPAP
jgi:hypothetical protein